jgi:hypothetical protein
MTRPAPKLQGYTAEQYVADLADVLPDAIPILYRIGILTICGQCGGAFDGRGFAVQACSENGTVAAVEIVAVCGFCVNRPPLPPEEWQYVNNTSALFYVRESWAEAVRRLRFLPLLSSIRGPCAILSGRL